MSEEYDAIRRGKLIKAADLLAAVEKELVAIFFAGTPQHQAVVCVRRKVAELGLTLVMAAQEIGQTEEMTNDN